MQNGGWAIIAFAILDENGCWCNPIATVNAELALISTAATTDCHGYSPNPTLVILVPLVVLYHYHNFIQQQSSCLPLISLHQLRQRLQTATMMATDIMQQSSAQGHHNHSYSDPGFLSAAAPILLLPTQPSLLWLPSHQTYCCHSYYYYYYLAATVPILAAKILLHPHSLHMISVPTSTTLQVLSPNSTVTYHHVTHHTILSMPLTAPGVPVSAVVLILYPISCQFQTTLDFVWSQHHTCCPLSCLIAHYITITAQIIPQASTTDVATAPIDIEIHCNHSYNATVTCPRPSQIFQIQDNFLLPY